MLKPKAIRPYKRLTEEALERSLREMKITEIGSAEYKKTMDATVTLHSLMDEDPKGVSKDTLALIAANLVGIILIIKHEHVNVVTSKALGLILKPR